MRLRVLSAPELREAVETSLGAPLHSDDGIAELLRAEVTARRACSRRALCDRTVVSLSVFGGSELERVDAVLEELVRRGDVTAAGGMVASAPLRVVDIADGRLRVHSSVPTRTLAAEPALARMVAGVDRVCRVDAADDSWRLAVSRLGGIALTPERWSLLDRVPPAGREWLDSLDLRLMGGGATAAGTAAPDATAEWRVFVPQGDFGARRRWRRADADPVGRLWRVRDARGWWVYAWTGGGAPDRVAWLRLSGDDAVRTSLSLDRIVGVKAKISTRHGPTGVEFSLDFFVPRAEYRWLTTMTDRVATEHGGVTYHCPAAVWPLVADTLSSRLGVIADDASEVTS